MKREMDPLKLRNAFEPMPDGCYNALMKAARSVKEERTVKRAALRTIAIAACIILAAMAAAVAAGSILGTLDEIPAEAREEPHLHLECLKDGDYLDPERQ